MSGGSEFLTKKGWPRPVIDGWPIPWISPFPELSQMSPTRMGHVMRDGRCQVCGEHHDPEDEVFIAISTAEGDDTQPPPDAVAIRAMDLAILHERCARLAVGRCPKLVALRKSGHLQVFRVKFMFVERVKQYLYARLEHVTRDKSFEDT